MEKKPLVSVIVPVYNVELYLERCIDSLLFQTYAHTEIILVDDGSTDGSAAICDRYKQEYPEKVLVIHKKNGGLSSARNTGLLYAKGIYVSFIDSDDWVEVTLYENAIREMEECGTDIVCFGRIDEIPKRGSYASFVSESIFSMDSVEAMNRILTWDKMDISACDKIYRRSAFEGISFPEGKNNEDICTIPKVIAKANRITHIGEPYYHYWHREGSITTVCSEKSINDLFSAVEDMKNQINRYYKGKVNQDALIFYINRQYLILY